MDIRQTARRSPGPGRKNGQPITQFRTRIEAPAAPAQMNRLETLWNMKAIEWPIALKDYINQRARDTGSYSTDALRDWIAEWIETNPGKEASR
jgi:hypothetical protein